MKHHRDSERVAEIKTRLRLLAVPRDGVIARGQYSWQAIHELEQQGYASPVGIDRFGKVKVAVISAQGRIARNRLLRKTQDAPHSSKDALV